MLVAGVLVAASAAAGAATDPAEGDRLGFFDPVTAQWELQGVGSFLYGNPGDQPVMGDWDCNGTDTPGLYRRVDTAAGPAGKVYLRNSNTTGIADIEFFYGDPQDIAVAGDWDGDGCDTVSLFRPSDGKVYLSNRLGSANRGIGAADSTYDFAPGNDLATAVPAAGDFDGDGVDTVALHLRDQGIVLIRSGHAASSSVSKFYFGAVGDHLVVGDWDGSTTETVGVWRTGDGTFHLRNSNDSGAAHLARSAAVAGSAGRKAGGSSAPIPVAFSSSSGSGGSSACSSAAAPGTPRALKEEACSELNSLPPTGKKQDDQKIQQAIDRLGASLDPALWFNDEYLTDAGGNTVFDREHQAVVELEKVLAVSGVQGAIDDIVAADRALAENAIQVAITSGGTAGFIAQAQSRLADGDAAVAGGDFAGAVLDYKKAWDAAQKAVQGINRFPIAVDDTGAAFEDGPAVVIDVLANDFDLDGDSLTVTGVSGGTGAVTTNGATVTYDPNGQFESLAMNELATDTFTYDIADGNGGTASASVEVTITGQNDPPTANDDGGLGFATDEDTLLVTGNVLDNDTDPDASDLLFVSAFDPTSANGVPIDYNGDGTFVYSPAGLLDALNAGELLADTFDYTVSDGKGGTDTATVTVDVTGVDDPPFAGDDSESTDEDTPITTGDVTVNDGDLDAADTVSVSGPANGPSGFSSSGGAKVFNNFDGTFAYDPTAAFQSLAKDEPATDSFSYEITSTGGGTATGTVEIAIIGKNDAPTADDQGVETSGSPVTIILTGSDPDAKDDLTFTVGALTGAGTLGTVVNDPNLNSATIGYTPGTPDSEGNDPFATFDFTVIDGNGGSATATVAINQSDGTPDPGGVTGVDAKDRLFAEGSGVEVEEQTEKKITLAAAAPYTPAPDPQVSGDIGDLTFKVTSLPTGTLTDADGDVLAVNDILSPNNEPNDPADPERSASVTYDPGTFVGTTSFQFEACGTVVVAPPPVGTTFCDTGTVEIEVLVPAPAQPPAASDLSGKVNPDSSATIDLSGSQKQNEAPPGGRSHTTSAEPDVYFLVDVSGSLRQELRCDGTNPTCIEDDIVAAIGTVQNAFPDAHFGLGTFNDINTQDDPDVPGTFIPPLFGNLVSLGPASGVTNLISPSGQQLINSRFGDDPEAQFLAFDRLADTALNPAGFDPDTPSVIVYIGDAPAHDLVCDAVSGVGDISEASVIAKLTDSDGLGIVVVANDIGGSVGLDADPVAGSTDYDDDPGEPNCVVQGSPGQATRITEATGGSLLDQATPAELGAAILDAIAGPPSEFTYQVTLAAGFVGTLTDSTGATIPVGTTTLPDSTVNYSSAGVAVNTQTQFTYTKTSTATGLVSDAATVLIDVQNFNTCEVGEDFCDKGRP